MNSDEKIAIVAITLGTVAIVGIVAMYMYSKRQQY